MLKKQRKWLSWALVVALLLSLLPANLQPARAETPTPPATNYSNPTLAKAVKDAKQPSNALIVNLSGKSIAGEVKVDEIKANFKEMGVLLLENNLITHIDAGSFTGKIKAEGNLCLPHQADPSDKAKLKFKDDVATIQRNQSQPEAIKLTDLWENIVSQTDSTLTLKTLAENGVVEKITMAYTTTAGNQSVEATNEADIKAGNLEISANDVAQLDASKGIKLEVKYKDLSDTVVTPNAQKIELKEPTLKLDLPSTPVYKGVSEIEATVTYLDENGAPIEISAADVADVNWTTDPANQVTLVPGSAEIDKGIYKAKLKIADTVTAGDLKLTASYKGKQATGKVTVAEANFDDFQLVELKASTGNNAFFEPYTSGKVTEPLRMLQGSAVASFNSDQFNTLKTKTGSTGKFFIKVPVPNNNGQGKTYRFLKPDEMSLVSVQPANSNLVSTIENDGDKVYLTFSANLSASEQKIKNPYTITLKTSTGDRTLTISKAFLEQTKAVVYYIYAFDRALATPTTIDAKIKETPDDSVYYIKNEPNRTQDKMKIGRPMTVAEGCEMVLVPVAEYKISENKTVRQRMTGVEQQWYQKEYPGGNFDSTPKRIKSAGGEKYYLDANGYPVETGGTETQYKGAPITARIPNEASLTRLGGSLLVKGETMGDPAEDKFANITLQLTGANNLGNFWFQVNWKPKKVASYVLVNEDYAFPTTQSGQIINNLNSSTKVNSKTFKQDLEEALKKVDGLDHPLQKSADTKVYGLNTPQRLEVAIGETVNKKILAIYDNGNVEEFSGEAQLTPDEDFQTGDIVISQSNPSSKVTFTATKHAGCKEVNGRYTDARSGGKAKLTVKGTDETIAQVILAPSKIIKVLWVANDDRMLTLNLENPLTTGKVSKGNWKGDVTEAGLAEAAPADRNPNIYVGNSGNKDRNHSFEDELGTRVYLLPVYTNEDLSFKKILENGANDPALQEKLQAFAWQANDWGIGEHQPIAYHPKTNHFTVATTGESADMAKIDQNTPTALPLTLDNDIEELYGHKIDKEKLAESLLGHPAPAGQAPKIDIQYHVLPPFYNRIGAISEKLKDGTTDKYEKEEIANNKEDKVLEVGSNEATAANVRIRLTNSNLSGLENLNYKQGEFDYGVYFYGTSANQSPDNEVLQHPSLVGPNNTNALNGKQKTAKDVALMTYLSGYGVKENKLTKYVSDINGSTPVSPYDGSLAEKDRKTILEGEAKKIQPVVYKKVKSNGSDAYVNADQEVTVQSDPATTPGTYKIFGTQRGEYYVTFQTKNGYPDALNDNLITPLVPIGKDGELTPLETAVAGQTEFQTKKRTNFDDLGEYSAGKDTYWFKIGVSRLPIGAIYNYVPGTDEVKVNDEGNVVVELPKGKTSADFDVYPVVVDQWLIKKCFDGNTPAQLTSQVKKTLVEAAGVPDFETLLTTPYSGVSYMTTEDFNSDEITEKATHWADGQNNAIATTAMSEKRQITNEKNIDIIKQRVTVDKAAFAQAPVGLQANAGDFDKENGATAKLINSPSSFTAAAKPIAIAPVKVTQNIDAVAQDIIVSPAENIEINSGETAKFSVKYRGDSGSELPITEANLNDANKDMANYLSVKQISGPEGATLAKQPASETQPAELHFTATKAGVYKYQLQAKNSNGALIPNLAYGKIITFSVRPSIKGHYDLYFGEELPINFGEDLTKENVTLEAQADNVLNAKKLTKGVLAIDENWPNLSKSPNSATNNEDVIVTVKPNDASLSDLTFTVTCHPRGGDPDYYIRPYTIFSDDEAKVAPEGPVELDRTGHNSFLITVNESYDGVINYVDPNDITIEPDIIYDASGNTIPDEFLTFTKDETNRTIKAELKADLPKGDVTWYGKWNVKISKDNKVRELHVRLNKDGEAVDPAPSGDYQIWELNNGELTKVTDLEERDFKLTDGERYLFVVDASDENHLKVVANSVITFDNKDPLNARVVSRDYGTYDTNALGSIEDLKNFSGGKPEHSHIRLTPKQAGNVKINTTDRYQTAQASVSYKVSDPADAITVTIQGEPTAPVENGTDVILKAVVSGKNIHQDCTYQWEKSDNSGQFAPISGQTEKELKVDTSAAGLQTYRVVVKNGSETVVSPSASVEVKEKAPTPRTITAVLEADSVNASLGGTATFKVKVTGNEASDVLTYEWMAKDPSAHTSKPLQGDASDPSQLTLKNLKTADFAREYYVKVKANGGFEKDLGPAKLIQGKIALTFDLGDGTIGTAHQVVKSFEVNHTITASDLPEKPTPAPDKKFLGWAPQLIGHKVIEPKTFTAIYYNDTDKTPGQDMVMFYAGVYGTFSNNSNKMLLPKAHGSKIAESEIPTPTPRAGFKFVGWSVDLKGQQVNGDTLVYALYRELKDYQVTFEIGQGRHDTTSPALKQTMKEDYIIQASDLPKIEAPAGAKFKEWTPKAEGHKVIGNVTFKATFESTGSGGTGGSGGSSGGGGGGGAVVAPTKPVNPTKPVTPTKPQAPKETLAPVELDQNYMLAYLQGYPGQVVRANGPITRAEVAAIFSRLLKEKMDESKTYTTSFNDIQAGKWYSNPIGYLEGFKIISGYQDGTFKPDKQLTRAEFASVIARFAKLDTTKKTSFSDVSEAHWAKDYIDNAVSHGWMGGYPDGTFKPNQPITRAEIVTVINKLINRTPDKAVIDGDSTNATKFKDLAPSYWAYYDVIEASRNK